MKTLTGLLVLFISLSAYAQDKNISVVSLEKANVVYFGIANHIKIAVPGAKSFEVTAPETLIKLDSLGNYSWRFSKYCDAKLGITAVMQNGDTLREQKIYELKGMGNALGTINGKYCNDDSCKLTLTKEELKKGKIGFKFENYSYDVTGLEGHFGSVFDGKVNSFTFFVAGKKGVEKEIFVKGDVMDTIASIEIDKLKPGDEIFITNIAANGFDKGPRELWIEITN